MVANAVQPSTKASEVRVQAGGRQPSYTWAQTMAVTSIMMCAAYGLGSIAYPHAVKGWRWLTKANSHDSDSDEAQSNLIGLLSKQVQQQEEANREMQLVVETVKGIQVRVSQVHLAGHTWLDYYITAQ